MTHSFDDVIINEENSTFSRMMFDVGRLSLELSVAIHITRILQVR